MGGPLASQVLFFVVAAILIASSLAMMFNRNLVHSTMYLAVALLSFAALYALLDAAFLALVQVFVYAGAAPVVILFVVMMTREQVPTYPQLLHEQTWMAVLVVAALSLPLVQSLLQLAETMPKTAPKPAATADLARALLTTQAAPFEIASVVLLAALVGAIYLAKEAE